MKGKFVAEDNPPARAVLVHLPEPLIDALDTFGKEHGTGRGKSIATLLEKVLEVSEVPPALPPALAPAKKDQVRLELVKKSDPLYVNWRKDHYIPDRGVVGQQLQYLIFYENEIVGVIGGASSVYTNEFRDEYFGLSKEKELKTRQLNSIVNNNIFRLTYPAPNLASIAIAMWRKRICQDWKTLYGIEVSGFETFVVEERLWDGRTRNGCCYRSDNWELVGISKGYKNTNVRGRNTPSKTLKRRKLVYCKKLPGKKLNTAAYRTSWGDAIKQNALEKKRREITPDPLDLLIRSCR